MSRFKCDNYVEVVNFCCLAQNNQSASGSQCSPSLEAWLQGHIFCEVCYFPHVPKVASYLPNTYSFLLPYKWNPDLAENENVRKNISQPSLEIGVAP